jgi:hypothetical protein
MVDLVSVTIGKLLAKVGGTFSCFRSEGTFCATHVFTFGYTCVFVSLTYLFIWILILIKIVLFLFDNSCKTFKQFKFWDISTFVKVRKSRRM